MAAIDREGEAENAGPETHVLLEIKSVFNQNNSKPRRGRPTPTATAILLNFLLPELPHEIKIIDRFIKVPNIVEHLLEPVQVGAVSEIDIAELRKHGVQLRFHVGD